MGRKGRRSDGVVISIVPGDRDVLCGGGPDRSDEDSINSPRLCAGVYGVYQKIGAAYHGSNGDRHDMCQRRRPVSG